jgi:hypothetical protein
MRRYTRHMSWERVIVGYNVGVGAAGWLAVRPGNLHERPALAPCPQVASGRLTLAASVACFVAASSSTTLQHEASAILDFP